MDYLFLSFQLWLSSDSAIWFSAAVLSIAQCSSNSRHSRNWWMGVLTLSCYFEHGNQECTLFSKASLLQPQALNHGICLRHIGMTFPRIIKLTPTTSSGVMACTNHQSFWLRLLQSQNPSQHRASNNHLPLSTWEKLICCCHLRRNMAFYHCLEQKNQMGFPTEDLSSRAKWFPLLISVSLAPPPCVCEHVHMHKHPHTYSYLEHMANILCTLHILKCPGRQRRSILWKVNSCIWWLVQLCSASSIAGDYVPHFNPQTAKGERSASPDPLYWSVTDDYGTVIYQAFPRSYKTRERDLWTEYWKP